MRDLLPSELRAVKLHLYETSANILGFFRFFLALGFFFDIDRYVTENRYTIKNRVALVVVVVVFQ